MGLEKKVQSLEKVLNIFLYGDGLYDFLQNHCEKRKEWELGCFYKVVVEKTAGLCIWGATR